MYSIPSATTCHTELVRGSIGNSTESVFCTPWSAQFPKSSNVVIRHENHRGDGCPRARIDTRGGGLDSGEELSSRRVCQRPRITSVFWTTLVCGSAPASHFARVTGWGLRTLKRMVFVPTRNSSGTFA
jgi:hypothetical protein